MSLYAPFSNNEDPCTGPWCLLAHTAVEWPVTGVTETRVPQGYSGVQGYSVPWVTVH